ncbi:glycosyltransferase 87 family protein [Streptomyces naganishii]|uniref:Membrane protein n=1 Tax=Streptomyces naganishii JCM 4654 TaxID=1306179 RepID=A0A918XYT9_9ACTN|nr:glycosyltransferase 87 family protein [Streptomyces naganishii]GHD83984.1 membrane protein [Streptomyces naganishii JCM 4654]
MDGAGRRWSAGPAAPLAAWGASRLVLLLFVLGALAFPGPDVTTDVSVIYRDWYEVLRHGSFPVGDVSWQYPPGAALAILAPAALPFLGYATAFAVLALLADLAVLCLLLYGGRGPGRPLHGAWFWTAGAPLLGPTLYARYDVMVTAVAVAALLAGLRRPRLFGALAGFGAMLKVWPLLLLAGARGRAGRRAWAAAAATVAASASAAALTVPGALSFLTAQRDRGTEVESLGALVVHVARHFGWSGQVLLHYGSVEFVGPYVGLVSGAALALTGVAFGWLALWWLRARRSPPGAAGLADAAFTAVLLFTTTSRVISPQYLVWLVGLGAVCLCFPGSRMRLPAWLVAAAAPVTVLEFPVFFVDVVASDRLGIALLLVRNGLLLTACVTAAHGLWRAAAPRPGASAPAPRSAPDGLSPAERSGTRATGP